MGHHHSSINMFTSQIPHHHHFLMASSHEDSSHPFHWHYAELDDKNFQVHGRSLLFIIICFSLLLLLTLFCLYARRLYHCRRQSTLISLPTAEPMAATTTTTHHPDPPPPPGLPQLGLDRATSNSFPIILHRSTDPNSDETQCSICLSTLQDEEKVKVLPNCNHCYHPGCVDKWLTTQSSCPLCRASARVDSSADSTLP